MNRITVKLLMLGILVYFASGVWALKPTMQALFRAKALVLPVKEQEFGRDFLKRDWNFATQDRGNFTFFSEEVKDLQVTSEGALKFRMDSDKVILGWGNYDNKQPLKERISLWSESFTVKIHARQSLDKESKWTMQFWCDGARESTSALPPPVSLEGQDWRELTFVRKISSRELMPGPDGFGLEIQGDKGNEVEIKNLRITRQLYEGYLRKEFEIPSGEIWRAVAAIGNQVILYVNGEEVPSNVGIGPRPVNEGPPIYWTRPVDLKPYLRPGKNCVGIYGIRFDDTPYLYLQTQVVMRSGETVAIESDETWMWSPESSPGWSQVGFDDSGWKKVSAPGERTPQNAQAVRMRQGLKGFEGATSDQPAYDGYLVLENPYESKLFYSDAKPVIVQVHIPDGLAPRAPMVEWTICKFHDGAESEIKSGEVREYAKQGDSLIYQIGADRLPRGVYTIHATLKSGDEVIEERIPEPFVVVGRLPMREVAGDTYEQGMDLTLEDEIDFTDPQDPHPWLETDVAKEVTEPIIVERNGLKYRETRPRYAAQYSYNVKFQHPGDFYLMVLEYPDDQERWMGASCTPSWFGGGSKGSYGKGLWLYAKCGPSVFTGGKYPVSNTMRQMKWIYLPEPGYHAINVMSIQKGVAGAAAGLKIYHIGNDLPALKITDPQRRWLGSITENCRHMGQSWGRTFMLYPEPNSEDRKAMGWAWRSMRPAETMCRRLQIWLDTCENYTQYLRFTGENLHVMGSYQYSDDYRMCIWAPEEAVTSRISGDMRDVALRVFRENGIDVLANIEVGYHSTFVQSPKSRVSNGRMQLGADTIRRVTKEGKQLGLGGRAYSGGWNFLHPLVENVLLGVAEYFAERFKDQPNFLGVNWVSYFGGEWIPAYRVSDRDNDPFGNTYDDAAIARFERDTKIRIPVSKQDPDRFQRRYQFLTSPKMKERWIRWRCEKMKQFFSKVTERVRSQRKDLNCVTSFFFYPHHNAQWKESGLPLRRFLRQWGWDPELYRKNDNLWFTHQLHATLKYGPALKVRGYATGWEQNVSKEFYDLFNTKTNRSISIHHAWLEIERVAFKLPERENWARPFQSTMQAHATGDYGREIFTQGLIGADPELVMFGMSHASLMIGNEQPYREFARVLRALPAQKFTPVGNTGFETNLALRDLRKGASYYFYVANPGYWPIHGSVTLTGGGRVVELAGNRSVKTRRAGGRTMVPVSLKPYGVAAYRVEGARAKVVSWETAPLSDQDLAHMTGILERVAGLLSHEAVGEVVNTEEKKFLAATLEQARGAIERQEYAKAWSLVTYYRFWNLWKDKLGKIASTLEAMRRSGELTQQQTVAISREYRVNCGSTEPYTDSAGKVWLPDNKVYLPGITAYGYAFAGERRTVNRGAVAIENTSDPRIYQTERYGDPVYRFRVQPGKYTVKLHFAECSRFHPGAYSQEVIIQGKTVLKDWDMNAEAGAFRRALIKTFSGIVVEGQELTLAFPRGKILGIEVLREK